MSCRYVPCLTSCCYVSVRAVPDFRTCRYALCRFAMYRRETTPDTWRRIGNVDATHTDTEDNPARNQPIRIKTRSNTACANATRHDVILCTLACSMGDTVAPSDETAHQLPLPLVLCRRFPPTRARRTKWEVVSRNVKCDDVLVPPDASATIPWFRHGLVAGATDGTWNIVAFRTARRDLPRTLCTLCILVAAIGAIVHRLVRLSSHRVACAIMRALGTSRLAMGMWTLGASFVTPRCQCNHASFSDTSPCEGHVDTWCVFRHTVLPVQSAELERPLALRGPCGRSHLEP